MDASNDSTNMKGLELIGKLERVQSVIANRLNEKAEGRIRYPANDLRTVHRMLTFAIHRLRFLEMVIKGLSFRECHDAAAYAKFVDSKRKIEDMDIDELREFLRER